MNNYFKIQHPKSNIQNLTSKIHLLLSLFLLVACAQEPLLRPNGVAVDGEGNVYVMDRGHYRVVQFNTNGKVIGTFGTFGAGPEDIHTGWDAALDSNGNILICNFVFSANDDLVHDGVRVFTPKGEFVREIGGQDYPRSDGGPVYKPYGLDVDAQDRVYLADYDANMLRIFDAQGRHLGTFLGEVGDGPGEINGINDVAVDDVRGLLYASDGTNGRIQQFDLAFDADGTPTLAYRASIGDYGKEPGQLAYPQGLAINDTDGYVYVADNANRRIQAFDPDGELVADFAPPDTPVWQVLLLAVGPDGAIYATDGYNNAIWVFEPEGTLRSKIEVAP